MVSVVFLDVGEIRVFFWEGMVLFFGICVVIVFGGGGLCLEWEVVVFVCCRCFGLG